MHSSWSRYKAVTALALAVHTSSDAFSPVGRANSIWMIFKTADLEPVFALACVVLEVGTSRRIPQTHNWSAFSPTLSGSAEPMLYVVSARAILCFANTDPPIAH